MAWWIDDRWELLGGCGCWQQLTHIRQAAAFLTEPDKATLNLVDIADMLCPTLTPHQLYRLASMFNDDETGTEGVSAEVGGVSLVFRARHSCCCLQRCTIQPETQVVA